MPTLASDLRRQLENVVVQARDLTKAAARASLKRWAVDVADPFAHFSAAAKLLEPKAQHLKLPGVTIKDEDDLKTWIQGVEEQIRAKLKERPVILSRTNMAEERLCLMTLFGGRADRQSLDQLNQLLDEGWRIAGIDPSLQRLEGTGNFKAFIVELMRPAQDSE